MNYYCCYWCYNVYDKEKVKKYASIEYINNYGFKILNGFCQGTGHQNRRSKCDLYRIKNDFIYESLDKNLNLKEERRVQFKSICLKKLCRRKKWYEEKMLFNTNN